MNKTVIVALALLGAFLLYRSHQYSEAIALEQAQRENDQRQLWIERGRLADSRYADRIATIEHRYRIEKAIIDNSDASHTARMAESSRLLVQTEREKLKAANDLTAEKLRLLEARTRQAGLDGSAK